MDIDPKTYTYPQDLLQDRIILITGASDGIGRALAIHAAEHGAKVILHGRNIKKLEDVYVSCRSGLFVNDKKGTDLFFLELPRVGTAVADNEK